MGDTARWRVMGQPSDAMSLVTREIEAASEAEAKERYCEQLGHKQVASLRARRLDAEPDEHGGV